MANWEWARGIVFVDGTVEDKCQKVMIQRATAEIGRQVRVKPHFFLKFQLSAVTVALASYFGIHFYQAQRYARAFESAQLGDALEFVTAKFGVTPTVETSHSGFAIGLTLHRCSAPCEERLIWNDPGVFFQPQAYYFEFDAGRRLIGKAHYRGLDPEYVRCKSDFKCVMELLNTRGSSP